MTHQNEREVPVPIVDSQLCAGCGLCAQVCPSGALVIQASAAIVGHPEACAYAGYCEQICPARAISRPFQIVVVTQKGTRQE